MNTPVRAPRIRRPGSLAGQQGLTLLEVMIAALILLFVILAMISGYSMGRINMDREEVKRRAIGLAQDRLEQIRARAIDKPANYDYWTVKSRIDTTYTVDGTTFTLVSTPVDSGGIRAVVPVEVSWTVYKRSGTATRSIRATGVITRDPTP